MDKITIELPAHAWNIVLNALAQRPYAEVFEVIVELRRQAEKAAKSMENVSVDQASVDQDINKI